VFEIGDIVYVENSFAIHVPSIIVDIQINKEKNDKWYRVIFFDNNKLLWYYEQELRRNANP
jgi:hypothetical protein